MRKNLDILVPSGTGNLFNYLTSLMMEMEWEPKRVPKSCQYCFL